MYSGINLLGQNAIFKHHRTHLFLSPSCHPKPTQPNPTQPPFSLSTRLLGVGSCSGCLYTYVVRSGADDVSRLYPHASTALALRPLPLARAVLTGAGALAAALAALAYALGVPVQDVASAVLRGEGGPGVAGGGGGGGGNGFGGLVL